MQAPSFTIFALLPALGSCSSLPKLPTVDECR